MICRWTAFVNPLNELRTVAATAAALAVGLARLASGRGERSTVLLAQGDRAPDFELPGSDGRVYRLADYAEREAVVLAWFPKAFTGGCTAECRSLGSQGASLRRFRARYFAVSVDSVETNRKFAESMGVDFPILSDPGKATARAYGVLGPIGFPLRWTFYIGLDGRILDVDKHVTVGTHGRDVASRLEELGVPLRG
jgi:peroxiredoxin Q/BCP